MSDAQEVKIIVHRSWEKSTSRETKWIQIPIKVPKDQLVVFPNDGKRRLWLDCHIGSEKIKTYEKVGHYRLSPLREFQKEENLPEQTLQDETIITQKGLRVSRVADSPFTGIAVSTHGNWRIEQAIKDGELESPIIFYKNKKEVYRDEFVKSTNPIRRKIPLPHVLSPTTPPVAPVIPRRYPSLQPAEASSVKEVPAEAGVEESK